MPPTVHAAPVAELVDAADSKSVVRKDVGVRVSLGAPFRRTEAGDANALTTAVTDDVRGGGAAGRGRVAGENGPGLWPVSVDRGRLRVAILHLLRNAEDAMPCGGTLLVAPEAGPRILGLLKGP